MSQEIKEGLVSKIKKFVTAKSRGRAAHERMGKVASKHMKSWFNSRDQIRSGKRMQGIAAVGIVKGGKYSKHDRNDFDRAQKHIEYHQGILDDADKRINRINKRRDQINKLTGLKEERLEEISKNKAEKYYFASHSDMTRRIQNQTSDDKHFERKLKNRQAGVDTAEGKAWPKMKTNSLYDTPVKKVKVIAKEEYINTAGDEATRTRRNKKRAILAKKATVVAEGIISRIKKIKPMKIGTKNTAMDSLKARQSAQTTQLKQRQAQERTQFKINNARKPKQTQNK